MVAPALENDSHTRIEQGVIPDSLLSGAELNKTIFVLTPFGLVITAYDSHISFHIPSGSKLRANN